MVKKHYLHERDIIQIEFDVEAEREGQTAIVVREGAENRERVHTVLLHPSVDFPSGLLADARTSYLPTLVHMPVIFDRIYRLCAEEELEFVGFIYNYSSIKPLY